jgi:hypothetical protein
MAGILSPLNDILARLTNLQDGMDNPLFQYCRVFNDHFNRMERQEIEAFPFPCALVEIATPIDFMPIGGGLAQADVIWRIHIGMQELDAGDGTMEQNLDVFSLYRDTVVAALSNFKPTACGLLFRVAEQPDFNHTNIYVYTVEFKCGFIDSKGSKYDPGGGNYIYTTPPTRLEIDDSKME